MELKRHALRSKLYGTKGKIFTLEFTKKDGSVRRMNCRVGVHKHLRGGEKSWKEQDFPNLVTVFDMQKKAYRNINLDTAREMVCGDRYTIVD